MSCGRDEMLLTTRGRVTTVCVHCEAKLLRTGLGGSSKNRVAHGIKCFMAYCCLQILKLQLDNLIKTVMGE